MLDDHAYSTVYVKLRVPKRISQISMSKQAYRFAFKVYSTFSSRTGISRDTHAHIYIYIYIYLERHLFTGVPNGCAWSQTLSNYIQIYDIYNNNIYNNNNNIIYFANIIYIYISISYTNINYIYAIYISRDVTRWCLFNQLLYNILYNKSWLKRHHLVTTLLLFIRINTWN